MNVGELFVNIGLSGGDKFLSGLNSANKSLSQIKETGLETIQRLNSGFDALTSRASGITEFGTTLKIFQESTGLSALTLQKFQKAFLGVNVSADETRQSIVQIQNLMNTLAMGRPISQSLAIALRSAGIGPEEQRNIYLFMSRLGKVSKDMEAGIGRAIFQELGLSGTMYQGLRRYTGDIAKLKPSVSVEAVESSAAIASKIESFKYEMEAGIASVLARPETAKALDSLAFLFKNLFGLFQIIMGVAEKSGAIDQVFRLFEMAIDGWKMIFQLIEGAMPKSDKKILAPEWLKKAEKDAAEYAASGAAKNLFATGLMADKYAVSGGATGQAATQSITVQQTNNFHGQTDPSMPGNIHKATKSGVTDAMLNNRDARVK